MPKRMSGYALQTIPLDAYGRIHGSYIAPHSLPADRNSVARLSDIVAQLGTVEATTVTAGTLGLGRVILGDEVNGLVVRNPEERTVFSIDRLTGNGRLGLVGTPGIDMTAGLLDMHGGAIRAGTIEAVSINLPGDLSNTLLTSDRIQVGSGTWGVDFSGFAISQSAAGGWIGGVQSVSFDTATGHIASVNPGGAAGTYINIGSGQIHIANPRSGEIAGTEYPSDIVFRSVMAGIEGDPDIITDIGLWSDGYGLNVVNLSSEYPAGLNLIGNDRTSDMKIRLDTTNGLMFMDAAGDYISFGQGTSAINKYAEPITLMTGDGDATLNLYGTHVDISGGFLQVTPCRGVWAAQPVASAETRAIIHFDSANNRWITEINGAWYAFDMTAV